MNLEQFIAKACKEKITALEADTERMNNIFMEKIEGYLKEIKSLPLREQKKALINLLKIYKFQDITILRVVDGINEELFTEKDWVKIEKSFAAMKK